jgi:C_GCAxxG_C_C family probable redox protein
MACVLNIKQVMSESINKTEFKVLSENDCIDIGEKGKEMIQKAYDLGYQFEEDHMGCARCTVASLQDAIDFLPADEGLFRAASCLDGGATPTQLANCGAFTGSGMVIGWMCGTQRFGDNTLSHNLIHKVHKCFKEEFGSVICKDIRNSADKKCPEVVAKAAEWTTEILLKKFTTYV